MGMEYMRKTKAIIEAREDIKGELSFNSSSRETQIESQRKKPWCFIIES